MQKQAPSGSFPQPTAQGFCFRRPSHWGPHLPKSKQEAPGTDRLSSFSSKKEPETFWVGKDGWRQLDGWQQILEGLRAGRAQLPAPLGRVPPPPSSFALHSTQSTCQKRECKVYSQSWAQTSGRSQCSLGSNVLNLQRKKKRRPPVIIPFIFLVLTLLKKKKQKANTWSALTSPAHAAQRWGG